MANSNSCYPKTIEECNIATDALMLEIANRMKFDSKFLVHQQENTLTLHEYEALFLEDMKICEDALDVILNLARKQKAYYEAMVTAKELEISMPEVIADTLTRISEQKNKPIELRERIEIGDFSFFKSTAEQDNPTSNTDNVESTILETLNSMVLTEENVNSESIPSISSRFIERPQYSDVACRLLSEMEQKKTHIMTPRVETQPQNCGLSHNAGPQHGEKDVCYGVLGSGGSNLDGSIIVDDGEESEQNGIRNYSPVVRVPLQPNFDDTGMESLCEPVTMPLSIIRAELLKATEGSKSTLNLNNEKYVSVLQPRNSNSAEYDGNDLKSGTEYLDKWTSSYSFRPRPKFTSSLGRLYNKE